VSCAAPCALVHLVWGSLLCFASAQDDAVPVEPAGETGEGLDGVVDVLCPERMAQTINLGFPPGMKGYGNIKVVGVCTRKRPGKLLAVALPPMHITRRRRRDTTTVLEIRFNIGYITPVRAAFWVNLSVRYDFRFFPIGILFAIAVPRWQKVSRLTPRANRGAVGDSASWATYPGLRNRAAQCVTKIPRPGRACTRRRTCAHARMRRRTPEHAGARTPVHAAAPAPGPTPGHTPGACATRTHPPERLGPTIYTRLLQICPPIAPFLHGSGKFAHPSHLFCTAPANLPTHRTFYARPLAMHVPAPLAAHAPAPMATHTPAQC